MFIAMAFSLMALLASSCATSNNYGSTGNDSTSCTPVYGNWCGPGYPSDGNNPRPVDVWDRACRAHDKCYEARGDKDKGCDEEFLYRLWELHVGHGLPMPTSMRSAQSWFTQDGYVSVYIDWEDLFTLGYDCSGGEGKRGFACATPSASCSKPMAIDYFNPAFGTDCVCRFPMPMGPVPGLWTPYPNSLP